MPKTKVVGTWAGKRNDEVESIPTARAPVNYGKHCGNCKEVGHSIRTCKQMATASSLRSNAMKAAATVTRKKP